jgi:O-succinylbenzoic acid--CoA ligase
MSFQVVFHYCTPDYEQKIRQTIDAFQANDFKLTVKSSGSTGKPKEIKHSKKQVVISAMRTNAFFGLDENSRVLCPISFDTIGGKMSLIRALIGEYEIHFLEPHRSFIQKVGPEMEFDLISLAPVQLAWIAENCSERLKQFENILVGGAAIPAVLEKQCMAINRNCYLGFGMTETISHIALRKFGSEYYQVLPGISVESLENGTRITDNESKLEIHSTDTIQKNDNQSFKWIGRTDFVINSGGIKIQPEELEKLIQAELLISTVIIGKADLEYGEKVVLVTETALTESIQNQIKTLIESDFGKYAVPKAFIVHSFTYLNGLKLDRRTLKSEIDKLT